MTPIEGSNMKNIFNKKTFGNNFPFIFSIVFIFSFFSVVDSGEGGILTLFGKIVEDELKEKSLIDNIIKEKFIEKWNGELPKESSSNNIMDVSKIIE